MLSANKIDKYSDVLIWALKSSRKKKYNKNDIILVNYHLPSLKLAENLQSKLIDMGFNPMLRHLYTPNMEHTFFKKANKNQLTFQPPGDKELFKSLNGAIYLYGPESLTHLSDIDPKKIGLAALARKPLRDILDKRENTGLFSWTLCMSPTSELAKQAKISIKQYTAQIIRACYLDKKDPVMAWKNIYRDATKIKKWLNSLDLKYLHVESENMDLKITPGEQRQWIGISGHNIPSFEIFHSPDWRGTEGVYYADQPSFRSGNYVEGVRIEFKNGNAIKISAQKGENFTIKQTSIDKGARRVGEFSLTDKRFSRINRFMANTLFDENYGGRSGNCHLALGSSYAGTFDGDPSKLTKTKRSKLGLNDSALHWDLVNTEKKLVTAVLKSGKSKVIYENGLFTY